jgi:hypothetical protein
MKQLYYKAYHWLSVYSVRLVSLYCIILVLPLVLFSLTLPFGMWDYFTLPEIAWGRNGIDHIFKNYFYSLLTNDIAFRPSYYLLQNIQYKLFEGQFWMWFLFKWAAKFLAIYLVWRILEKLKVNKYARLFSVVFLLFHPAIFEIMLFSADGWLALGVIILIYYLITLDAKYDLKIEKFTLLELISINILLFGVIGLKEMAFPAVLISVVFIHWKSGASLRVLLRMIPSYIIILFTCARLVQMMSNERVNQQITLITKLKGYYSFIFMKGIVHNIPLFIFLVLLIYGIYEIVREKDKGKKTLMLFILLVTGSMFMFLLATNIYPAPRYIIPIYYTGSLLLAFGIEKIINGRNQGVMKKAITILIIGIPLFTSSNIYGQYLAYAQRFYEEAQVISYLDSIGVNEIVVSGENEIFNGQFVAGLELQGSYSKFFEQYRDRWYDAGSIKSVKRLEQIDQENTDFVMVTSYPPGILMHENKITENLTEISYVPNHDFGLIENLYGVFEKLDHYLSGTTRPLYDVGAPILTNKPFWNIYKFSNDKVNAIPINKVMLNIFSWDNYTTSYHVDSNLLKASSFVFNKGDINNVKFNLESKKTITLRKISGKILVDSGSVVYGITDQEGNDVWNKVITGDKSWQDISIEYTQENDDAKKYLFFYSGGGEKTTFRLKDITFQDIAINVLTPPKKFGAIFE